MATNKDKDKFGVIASVVPLINEHLQYRENLTVDAINTAHKTVKQELIAIIGVKSNKTTTIKELALLFRDSCLSFVAVGKRADLLIEKVKGPITNPKMALDTAIRKDVETENPNETESVYLAMGGDDVTHIVNAAYEPVISGTSIKILYLPILYQYLDNIGSTLSVPVDDVNYKYKRTTNRDFINIFANKAKSMLESDTAEDYYEALKIKKELHAQLAYAYFYSSVGVSSVYSMLTKILGAVGQGKVLTNGVIAEMECCEACSSSILIAQRSLKGEVYAINKMGLLSYVDALETLGLGSLTGVTEIIDLIKKHCA